MMDKGNWKRFDTYEEKRQKSREAFEARNNMKASRENITEEARIIFAARMYMDFVTDERILRSREGKGRHVPRKRIHVI